MRVSGGGIYRFLGRVIAEVGNTDYEWEKERRFEAYLLWGARGIVTGVGVQTCKAAVHRYHHCIKHNLSPLPITIPPPSTPPPSPPSISHIPPPLLTNLLMRRILQRPLRITPQLIPLKVLAHIARMIFAWRSVDLPRLWCSNLGVGLFLGFWGLAAGIGCGHFW